MKYIVEVTKEKTVWKDFDTGLNHRLGEPAVEWASGTKEWFKEGKLYRLDGPAVEYSNGNKYWYIENIKYSEKEFLKITKPAPCDGKVVEIEGVKYKLTKL